MTTLIIEGMIAGHRHQEFIAQARRDHLIHPSGGSGAMRRLIGRARFTRSGCSSVESLCDSCPACA